ncbi:MAG: superoxide dismutase family protein, partial [Myxococcales bacterium]|nr:superoxide dismutase family protein [Myxococcales bacterium]
GTSGTSGTSGNPTATVAGAQLRAGLLTGGVTFFEQDAGGTLVQIDVEGATPGNHGVHIHDGADCNTPGSHWNPTAVAHGLPSATPHHVGDLGNVLVDANGNGVAMFTTTELYVHAGAGSVVGRPLVFHSGADDGVTQPSGNAGAPTACGIIKTP